MSSTTSIIRGPVYFCFTTPAGFSGQKAATELVIKGLTHRKWLCRTLPQPVLAREKRRWLAVVAYLWDTLAAWVKCVGLLAGRGSWLCVNLGQTRTALLRNAIPLLFGRVGLGTSRVVISLHGSLFMKWLPGSFDARIFCFLLKQAGVITVLGERQRRKLIELGIPDVRVHVVVNSCDLELASIKSVEAKHPGKPVPGDAVHCLYLSSLIDTKGFPEYLDALRRLTTLDGPRIEAVMCGRLVESEFSDRFPDAASAEGWIEAQLAEINRSSRVRVRWVKGAMGAQKAGLFREAQIFVLPTRYAVEAQPLVLLEAMASGCAIVTTRAGEIPTILDERSAVFLPEPSVENLAKVLQTLIESSAMRASLAISAHERFVRCYQFDRHIDEWEKILEANPARCRDTV